MFLLLFAEGRMRPKQTKKNVKITVRCLGHYGNRFLYIIVYLIKKSHCELQWKEQLEEMKELLFSFFFYTINMIVAKQQIINNSRIRPMTGH